MDYPKFINLIFLCDLLSPCVILFNIQLAKWLIQLLNPVLAFYSGFCVYDSFTFSSMISCVDFQFMVSFDITSLLTNVPLDEVISISVDLFLYRSPLISVPSFRESISVKLMELASKSVSFSFNDVKLTVFRWVLH